MASAPTDDVGTIYAALTTELNDELDLGDIFLRDDEIPSAWVCVVAFVASDQAPPFPPLATSEEDGDDPTVDPGRRAGRLGSIDVPGLSTDCRTAPINAVEDGPERVLEEDEARE